MSDNDIWAPLKIDTENQESSNSVTITVPDDRVFFINVIYVTYAANSTGGDRLVTVKHLDTDGSLTFVPMYSPVPQIADTTHDYVWAMSGPNDLSVDENPTNDTLRQPLLGPLTLGPGDKINVSDVNNVSSAADEEIQVRIIGMQTLYVPHASANFNTTTQNIST